MAKALIRPEEIRTLLDGEKPYAAHLRYHRITLCIEGNDQPTLQWLSEFLVPSFKTILPSPDYDVRIRFVSNQDALRQLKRRGPYTDPFPIETFALDTTIEQASVWRSTPTELFVRDHVNYVFYLVDQRRKDICILAASPHVDARMTLMRVVRESTSSLGRAEGGHTLHAAAFSINGRAIALAGAKKAGKTTLLLHALMQASAAYVANDRLFVFKEREGGFTARGMPTIVSIRKPSLTHLKGLESKVANRTFDQTKSLRELRAKDRLLHVNETSLTMSPAQLCDTLDLECVDQAKLGALVFPEITGERGTIELKRLPPQQSRLRLTSLFFRAESDTQTGELFRSPTEEKIKTSEAQQAFYASMLDAIPCYACSLGTEAYHEGVLQDQFIVPLLEPASKLD